jgi:transcriptional regulator with XRE-family HTH domain
VEHIKEDKKEFNKIIGNNLKNCIRIAGYNQREFAKMLGVSEQALFKWTSARATPDIYFLVKTCKILNLNFDKILVGLLPIKNTNQFTDEEVSKIREILKERE